jgi:hypothetical protein
MKGCMSFWAINFAFMIYSTLINSEGKGQYFIDDVIKHPLPCVVNTFGIIGALSRSISFYLLFSMVEVH